MRFTDHPISWRQAVQVVGTGVFALTLALLAAGCGGAGANGDDGGGDDGGDDDGDGTTVPAAPSGLTAGAQEGAVELSWQASDSAETYRVYRAESSTEGVEGSAVADGLTQTSYTDTGVENGTTYYYRVTAVADEEGEPSGEAESTPFAPPSGLEGTSGDSQVELDWAAAVGAVSYNVYRSTDSTSEAGGDPLTTGVSGASYVDEAAENGTKYYYWVRSVNPEEEESATSNRVGKAPFSDPPDRP